MDLKLLQFTTRILYSNQIQIVAANLPSKPSVFTH